jgi:hypothetical protein
MRWLPLQLLKRCLLLCWRCHRRNKQRCRLICMFIRCYVEIAQKQRCTVRSATPTTYISHFKSASSSSRALCGAAAQQFSAEESASCV